MLNDFFEFNFKSAEYLTEDSWQWRWRQFFLMEIRDRAQQVLRDLAKLLPEWRESVKNVSLENPETWSDSEEERLNEFFYHLGEWQEKYGLDTDQSGGYPGWVWGVVNQTFRRWDKYTVNLDDVVLGFDFIGVYIGPLEHAMMTPDLLVKDLKIQGMNTEEELEEKLEIEAHLKDFQKAMRSAAAGVELILPPMGFPSWWPVFQTKKKYLLLAEDIIQKRISNDPILCQAESSTQKAFIKAVLEPVNLYCQKIAKHYEESGYKKPPNIRTVEEQIAWTVQVQVLGRRMTDVAEENNKHLTRVQLSVNRVLKNIDLALRSEITPGRPKHSKNSPLAPHRKSK